jgi:hypothetical protein
MTLRGSNDDRGSRSLVAELREGDLVLDGRDTGRAVEEFFGEGSTEYAWTLTVAGESVPAAIEALGGNQKVDVLEFLKRWYDDGTDEALRSALESAGVPVEFTSRLGD